MGVVTQITLSELNKLFPSYNFTKITPTTSGIVDTTYILYNKKESYILKRYERDIAKKIAQDIALLYKLKSKGLNVPIHLDESHGWHIYTKLKGSSPTNVKSYHIQAVARFLAKMHKISAKTKCNSNARVEMEVIDELRYTKENYFSYYKKFEFLKYFTHKNNLLIHGDIFKDNTIFDGRKIGVIDFIDSFCATSAFDSAVALVGFDVRVRDEYFINIFLIAYNQHALKKLTKEEIKKEMRVASHFYALKRVAKYKNTLRAKELLR